MKVVSHPKSEMKKKKEKNSGTSAARKKSSGKKAQSELDKSVWSVITFETCAASSLTYAKAAEKLEKLKAENISGLCIVTDDAAARITSGKK